MRRRFARSVRNNIPEICGAVLFVTWAVFFGRDAAHQAADFADDVSSGVYWSGDD
ncbi:MAG: hypothetical protein HWE26_13630 [Alteromonadaceae bacterium]|nr:hypothetical protein [Alteromonadaceae bacterium]